MHRTDVGLVLVLVLVLVPELACAYAFAQLSVLSVGNMVMAQDVTADVTVAAAAVQKGMRRKKTAVQTQECWLRLADVG